MGYRRFNRSKPTVRAITVKYAGKCMCCGGEIAAGQIADFYPVGTIAGVHEGKIAHLKAVEGNSVACYQVLKSKASEQSAVDAFDMQYEDDCRDRCGL